MSQRTRWIYLGIKNDGEIIFAKMKSRGKKHAVAKAKVFAGPKSEVKTLEPWTVRHEKDILIL